ncbi:MAG: NFYB/HAP3 family transcription factor subunit [Candidatus Aenigmatarchaeota archaeon]
MPEEKENINEPIEEEIDEEKANLPLPMAPIVRIMKSNLDGHKLIRKQVKEEMNKWLAKICAEISKEMNNSPYPTVDLPLFKQAVQKYENVEELKKEKERIVVALQKIKLDCDSIIRDLDRKFDVEG